MEQDNFFAEVELKGQFVESGKNILSMYHFNFYNNWYDIIWIFFINADTSKLVLGWRWTTKQVSELDLNKMWFTLNSAVQIVLLCQRMMGNKG